MFGLISTKIELPFNTSVERLTEALQTQQAGMRVHIDGNRFILVYEPNSAEPVSVLEGCLTQGTRGCSVSGTIRWTRPIQILLLIALGFLAAFCFGIPVLMISSYLSGSMSSAIDYPLAIPLIWAVVTSIPFYFLLRPIFRSRLPEIESRVSRIIQGEQSEMATPRKPSD